MKFSVSSHELLHALTTVNGAVPTKSTLPILECILFQREGDHLQLSATDLEISIVERLPVSFDADLPEASRVAVPARRLLETLRALPDLPVQFSADPEFHVELRTDQGRYKMVGNDGDDYPALPQLEEETAVEASGSLLKRAIQKTGFAVSKDALRPAMMGIYFSIQGKQTEMVATDGHRLVKLRLADMTSPDQLKFIVPEKALSLAGRILNDETCTIAVGGGYAGFQFGETKIMARIIDEAYPNYEAVIPYDNDRQLFVNRMAMLAAVKRVSLYSSSMTHQIRLSLRQNEVEISAEDIERSSEARETVICEYDNEPMEIGFNSLYLAEILSNLDSDDVVFKFGSPNRAGVVMPIEQHEAEEILMLIMPVMLNTYA